MLEIPPTKELVAQALASRPTGGLNFTAEPLVLRVSLSPYSAEKTR